MAGGGIAGAILTLKQNRGLLHKRKLKSKGDVYGKEGLTKLNLKKSTPQDMRLIKEKIKGYKRRERQMTAIPFLITAVFSIGVIYGLFKLIISLVRYS